VKGDGDKKKTKFQEEVEKLKMLQFQNHAVEDESANKKDGGGNDEKKDDSTKGGAEEQVKNAQPDETTVNIKPSPTSPLQQPEKNESSTNLKPVEEKDTNEGSSEIPQAKVSSTAGESDSKNTTAAQPNATPNPSSQANNAPAPQRVRPPAVAPAAVNNNNNFAVAADAPIISDSLLNGMIGFFAVIVIVLLRQSQALVDELQQLGRDD